MIIEEFVAVLAKVVAINVDWSQVGEDTSMVSDLMIDSIALVSLIVLCEEKFGVDLAQRAETIADLETVGDALRLIRQAKAEAPDAVKVS